jgi:hypothetical protein
MKASPLVIKVQILILPDMRHNTDVPGMQADSIER